MFDAFIENLSVAFSGRLLSYNVQQALAADKRNYRKSASTRVATDLSTFTRQAASPQETLSQALRSKERKLAWEAPLESGG